MRLYYQKWLEEQVQKLVDDTSKFYIVNTRFQILNIYFNIEKKNQDNGMACVIYRKSHLLAIGLVMNSNRSISHGKEVISLNPIPMN